MNSLHPSQSQSRGTIPLPLIGGLLVLAAVLITFYPALGNGFYQDEFIRLDKAVRFGGWDYWALYFDPRVQDLWYRPMVGIQWKIEYLLFGANFPLYHLVQVVYHAINCLLLYYLIIRLTARWRTALVSALVYGVLPLTSMSVYWTAVHDPLAGTFCLLALIAWLDYLDSGSRLKLALTYIAFVTALMSKEISLSLPVLFFLADYLLSRKPFLFGQFLRRYVGFAVLVLGYLVLWVIVATRSVFTQQIGVRIGTNIFSVFVYYLAQMALPWQADDVIRYLWLAALVAILLYAFIKVDRKSALLVAGGTVPVLAVSAIPPYLSNTRYVYLPMMAWAAILSFVLARPVRFIPVLAHAAARATLALLVAIAVFGASAATSEQIVNFGGFIREIRLQFRPIYQAVPSVQPDTLLYFFDTPIQSEDISGLMFLRYGANSVVLGVDRPVLADWRRHAAAFVLYPKDDGAFDAVPVENAASVEVSPALPVRFGDSISLVGLEVASTHVKRGYPIAVLAYWKAALRLTKDYTVFAHLVNANGEIVAGYDSQPRKGRAPTTNWQPQALQPDGLIIPIEEKVPAGDYRLEIGWYDAASGQRLSALDASGVSVSDKVIIGSFSIQ